MKPHEPEMTRDEATPAATGAADDLAPPGPRPRILVVDDVFDNRDILTRRLVRRGFDVVEACGGHEALERLREGPVDLVLLDIMMPDMCGNEVLRTIRQTRSALELPVIMVTAKSQSEDVVESLDLGANDYVTKPVDFAVALARIKAHLSRKRTAEAEILTAREAERRARDLHRQAEEIAEAIRGAADSLAAQVDQRRESEDRLHYLAYHDGLTGLMNRTAFREAMNASLQDEDAAEREAALIFIDLDRFKSVNDVYGHEVGDKLLQEVAERLRPLVGAEAFLARLGGDEFGAFLPGTDAGTPGAAAGVAAAIVAALAAPFLIDDQQFRVGASCGVATTSLCGLDLWTLSKAADLAMYRAKVRGRGQFVEYEPAMLEEIKARSELEVQLRQAIQDKTLDVVYQPLIDAATLRVSACEALVRWNHPVHGEILPEKFIPIAEETGLIVPLGAFVLRRACAEAAGWPDDVRVAVNLSPLQFRTPGLIDMVDATLAATGLSPYRLELEITESALLEAGEQTLDILHAIRERGIRVSMDDFGTGYSSVSYLQNFGFDKIKIDRSFIRGVKPGQNGAAIIKAIADLGTAVGVDLTAEGIETSDELAVVASYGCKELQGFLFSKPLGPEDARAFIARTIDRDAELPQRDAAAG